MPQTADAAGLPADTQRLLHDLRVHQAELEAQNEELRRTQLELDATRARYFDLCDLAPVGYVTVGGEGLVLEANLTAATLLGVARGALVQRLLSDFILNEDQDLFYLHRRQVFATGAPQAYELRMVRPDGTVFWAHQAVTATQDAAGAPVSLVVMNDNPEHNRDAEALRESEARYRRITEGLTDYLYTVRVADGRAVETMQSAACARVTGYTTEDFAADPNLWIQMVPPEDRDRVRDYARRILAGEDVLPLEHRLVRRDGAVRWVSDTAILHRDAAGRLLSYDGVISDITERKRMEEERAALEAQLQQAQKLESVGSLAGGVAHDFNNMLGVILGHSEVALSQVDSAHPLHGSLEQIREAALRSAALTRQLLAFARKQIIAPKVLDLNATVAGMRSMLVRLIGEDIDLRWQPGTALWPVEMDPSQVDQVLANLCVNARDAIADVGKVTLETANATFDADYCVLHAGFQPGEYVRLAVSDDGCGMDAATQTQIFEPFFTTKEAGKGTGLGLATVYGIVKQNRGFINVYSEPGHGTTFALYLPRHAGTAAAARVARVAQPLARGHETILLVEDEPAILTLTATILEDQGYTVLAAGTPGAAIGLAREYAGPIHLLMTDVVMPEMNGRDLARNLLARYPHLRRLFMSGYTADVIAHHGVLDAGVHFIQKPFSIASLSAKVREALAEE